MAALGHTVDSGSGASGNYASVNALNSAQAQDLTDGAGDTYTATCTTTGDNASDTTATTFNGWGTAAANWFLIDAASGDKAVKTGIDATRFRFEFTNGVGLRFEDDFLRVNGIQAQLTVTPNNEAFLLYQTTSGAGSVVRISNSYFKGVGAGTGAGMGIRNDASNTTMAVWNTVLTKFYSADNTNTLDWSAIVTAGGTVNAYNCIMHGNSYGAYNAGGTLAATNCASFDNDTNNDFGGTVTVNYCASDDGDGGNAVAPSGADWDNEFLNSANGNFTLVASGNCEGGGTDDPAGPLYDTDMDGDAYTSPQSIGVDAKVAAPVPSGSIVPIIMQQMDQFNGGSLN